MENINEYINSGILEEYVLGIASPEEAAEVENMAASHLAVQQEIDNISLSIEKYALANAIPPDPTVKPFLLAVIDYSERLKAGEVLSYPPIIGDDADISDFAEWINRPDMHIPDDFSDFYAKIIGNTPEVTTAIVWIKEMAPQEMHEREIEKFLILEGSCTITIEGDKFDLKAGDTLSIPLYKKHDVKITSAIPCKIILQRVAA